MFSFPINKKLKKGFTLIEILIVVAIIAFVSTISMTYMVTAQKQFRYVSFYNKVVMATRLARVYAATDYTLFADTNNNPSAFCVRITKNEVDVFVQMKDDDFCELPSTTDTNNENFYLRQYIFSTDAPQALPEQFTLDSSPNEVALSPENSEIYLSYTPRLESFSARYCTGASP